MNRKKLQKLTDTLTKNCKHLFRGFDKDNDGCVNVLEWIHGLSLFLRGSLEKNEILL
uniref:cDNA, FLJ78936 n=1 Tax=Homo sapiens TaxID=9606 RepID=B7Z9S2_HUMAN|nr:unnamed protein product [Homo sapiens]